MSDRAHAGLFVLSSSHVQAACEIGYQYTFSSFVMCFY